jgi:hypothetical protein
VSEPLYERVGREPLDDAQLEAAVAALRADRRAVNDVEVARLRRLNAEARQREADMRAALAAGTTVEAVRQARAEDGQRLRRMRHERDMRRARKAIRPAGGPPRGDGEYAVARIEATVDELWRADPPTQEAVADALGCTARWLSEQARPDGGWKALVERVRARRHA